MNQGHFYITTLTELHDNGAISLAIRGEIKKLLGSRPVNTQVNIPVDIKERDNKDAVRKDAVKMEPVELIISKEPEPYVESMAFMERRVADIRSGHAPEALWLLQHPSLYTAGTSADPDELVDPTRFPTFNTGRGGRYTYHGPGQRIAYLMMDLGQRGKDVRAFVHDLEKWLIATLADFDIRGERRRDRIGIWIKEEGENIAYRENKIAALGIRVRRWVTFHGVSINVDVDLKHFRGIVPCGISDAGVTSLQKLGLDVAMNEVDLALTSSFEEVFGRCLEIRDTVPVFNGKNTDGLF